MQEDNLINFFDGGYYLNLRLDVAMTCQFTYTREIVLKMCFISHKKLIFYKEVFPS